MDDILREELAKLKPGMEKSSKEELMKSIKDDVTHARRAREIMPHGFCLDGSKQYEETKRESLGGYLSKVGHICRVVKDADVSRRFYEKVLGAEELNRPKFPTNGFWLWLGNVQLHLIQSDLAIAPDHPEGGTRVNHISFDVHDLGACEQRLIDAGIPYQKVVVPLEETHKGINQLFFQDPDFHWIELCDCHKFNDFVFGDYDEERAHDLAVFYHEGVDLAQTFLAACILLLLAGGCEGGSNRLYDLFHVFAGDVEFITAGELQQLLARMGEEITESSINDLMSKIDDDGDNQIDFGEFKKFIHNLVLSTPTDDIAEAVFRAIDGNASGGITKQEFEECFNSLGVKMSKDRLDGLFDKVDADHSGVIDKNECGMFVKMFLEEVESLEPAKEDMERELHRTETVRL